MKIIKKIPKPEPIEPEDDFEESLSESNSIIDTIETEIDVNDLIPTGSTTFNLECSGHYEGAFKIGKMVNLIGDSSSGKSFFGLTIFAECTKSERFKNHRFIYDDVEAANEFNIPKLFGQTCADRIEHDIRSRTIEDFSDNVVRCLEAQQPFIYILDSFDGLTSEAIIEKDQENRKKREKGAEIKGDYGDGKPKIFSRFCSMRIQEIADADSFLLVISQTRDNIGFGAMFSPKTRSGGKALKFYACHEVWLACQKKEKEGKRVVQTNVQAKITKNKLTGMHGEVYFPILMNYGVDDIVSCVNFLLEEGGWTKVKTGINTKGFVPNVLNAKKEEVFPNFKQIVEYVETRNKELELKILCQQAYDDVMAKLNPNRKLKYI